MPAKEPFPRQRGLHDRAYLARETARRGLLLELKIYVGQTFLFLENPFLRRSLPEQRNVLKEDLHNFLVIL